MGVYTICDKREDPMAKESKAETQLREDVRNTPTSVRKVKKFFDDYANGGARDEVADGLSSSLHNLVAEENLDAVTKALEVGADPNGDRSSEITPLGAAVDLGNVEICKVLLQHGASIVRRDSSGLTPLQQALEREQYDEIRELFFTHIEAMQICYNTKKGFSARMDEVDEIVGGKRKRQR